MKRQLVNQVRELLERNLSTSEIAHRMGIDLDLAKMAVDAINQLLTWYCSQLTINKNPVTIHMQGL